MNYSSGACSFLALALISCAALSGCPKAAIAPPPNVGPTVVPPSNMFLRNAFDTDPSVYIGRFVPDGVALVDESSAMQLTCSQYIGYRSVGGGGVVYDELFNSTSDAAAKVGVPLVASASASGSLSSMVRVRYELTNKMVAEIRDPSAFEACCKQAPDQCTGRYVGEFLEGKGAVWFSKGAAGNASASGISTTVAGDLEVSHGMSWQRSVEFPNAVYFAMKTSNNNYSGQTVAGCGDWVNAPPRSTLGQYFVGVSDPVPSERIARDAAMLNARTAVVKWVGESITAGTLQTTTVSGNVASLSASLDQQDTLQTAATGVASMVKDESWCVTTEATPGGTLYTAKVLALLPKASQAAAAETVLQAAQRRP